MNDIWGHLLQPENILEFLGDTKTNVPAALTYTKPSDHPWPNNTLVPSKDRLEGSLPSRS